MSSQSGQSMKKHFSQCNDSVKAKTNLCRVCLKQGTIDIYGDASKELAEAICTIAGVQVSVSDPYPKHLCEHCHNVIQDAILFRDTAQNSDKLLRKNNDNERFVTSNILDSDLSMKNDLAGIKQEPGTDISVAASGDDEIDLQKQNTNQNSTVETLCKCDKAVKCSYCSYKQLTSVKTVIMPINRMLGMQGNAQLTQQHESLNKGVEITNVLQKPQQVTPLMCNEINLEMDNEFSNSDKQRKKQMLDADSKTNVESDSNNTPHHNPIAEEVTEAVKRKFQIKEKILTCKYCNIQVNGGKEYLIHAQTPEHKRKRNYCSICNKSFSETYMRKHRRRHKNPEREEKICDVCGKKFFDHGNFRRHRITHTTDLPYKCSLCPYRGQFAEYLKSHMNIHSDEKQFICDECPERFARRCNLTTHKMKAHTNQDQYKFVCDCGKKYTSKQRLDMHFQLIHMGKMQKCDTCGKGFNYLTSLRRHELKIHKREKLNGRSTYLRIEMEKVNEDRTL